MVTATDLADFRTANQRLVDFAHRDLRDFWSSLKLDGDPDIVRSLLREFFPNLVSSYGATAAVLSADFYDMLRDTPRSASRFQAVIADAVGIAQAEGSARWAVGPLFLDDPDPDRALANLLGASQRLVRQPGRDSIWSSAMKDPVRTGVARIPRGGSTCRFCVMLASRGAVYTSKAAAGGDGNQFHDDCDCELITIRSPSDYPDGYANELTQYRRLYASGSGLGRDAPRES